MFIYDIIDKKRKGLSLTNEEITFAVNGFVSGKVLPEQMSALLMAIMIKGMNKKETYCLTKVMQASGKTYSFPFDVVDKHSSGGVGDSTTLILLPVLSSLGVKVAKMSGKSLGFTGGTIDKVSCFKNFNTELSQAQFEKAITNVGGSIISQSADIALADKKIYDLRDKCACVESIPLIASSIMSKKLASGSNTILLDVKYGSGAFMKTKKSAIKLAKTMVDIGMRDGKNIMALVTNMNAPLSRGIGCAQEVYSVIKALDGEQGTLLTLSKVLSSYLLSMSKKLPLDESESLVNDAITSRKAKAKLKEIILNQSGSIEFLENPEKLLLTKVVKEIKANSTAYVKRIDALTMAKVQKLLADGVTEEDKKFCGIMLDVAEGDFVKNGQLLGSLYTFKKVSKEIENLFLSGFEFSNKKPKRSRLVAKVIK